MAVDWKSLRPHVPASWDAAGSGGLPVYVPRPENHSLDALIRETTEPVAVVGPAGSGKSSALGRVSAEHISGVVFVPVLTDHAREYFLSLPPGEPDDLAFRALVTPASVSDVLLATEHVLGRALLARGIPDASGSHDPSAWDVRTRKGLSNLDAVRSLAREWRRVRGASQLVLLLDGMERLPAETIRADLERLLLLREELRVVAVLPAQVFYGPDGAWMTEQFRVYSVPPVVVAPTNSPHAAAGRAFLREVLRTRVGDEGMRASADVLESAISLSGGIPRTFLQLVQDSAMYARLAGREVLRETDLTAAVKDQRQSLRRLLDQGDKQEILRADGTDGAEIPRERRARLIASGLLLEYEEDGELVVHPAPILEPILRRPAA
jgi:hypothetical protein